MKIRRYKKAFKNLGFYVNNFGFHKPFQILIDGTFCFAALQSRIQIKEDIPKYLGSEIKFLTTQCVVLETEKLGHTVIGAMRIAKSFGIHNCGHAKNPRTGSDCLLSMVGACNGNRYIIATQDKDLQIKLQNVPAVPILYINRTSIVLKPLSEASLHSANERKQAILGLSKYQEQVLNSLKMKAFGTITKDDDTTIVGRKPRGPNPLSYKKKQKQIPALSDKSAAQSTSTKRRRKRIRLPDHVKQEIFNELKS